MNKNQTGSSNPKEIIVVTVEIGVGGAERVLTELMEAWVRKGYHVTLVQTRPGIYGHSYSLADGIENVDLSSNAKTKVSRYLGETVALLRFLKTKPTATIVAFANASIRIVGVCSFFIKNRIVFSERCDPRYTPPSKLMRWLRDRLFGLADVCVFQTEQAKALFPRKARERGVVIPNPINTNLPSVYHGEHRQVIMTACRLAPQKNLPMLIKAFAKIAEEYPEYKLEIYGSGDEENALRQLIADCRIEKNAFLMGHSSNIYQIMRECGMYVCTSDYEGLSNSILEALCLGLPVISTDHPVGGAREMITDHVDGLLVPVGDTEALYRAMKYIIDHPDEAQKMGEEAAKIRSRWPIGKIADRWTQLF